MHGGRVSEVTEDERLQEDDLLQQEAHELEEMELEQGMEKMQHSIWCRCDDCQQRMEDEIMNELQELEENEYEELEQEEQEHENEQEQVTEQEPHACDLPVLISFADGDYVKLTNLKQADLNGEKGTVAQSLDTGRLCIELGSHKTS